MAGFTLRVRNLGRLSFWSDDGFTFLAVTGILEKGFPLLPSGFVYCKHIFYSYAAAIPVIFSGMNEFSLRLMGVIFGTCMIPAVYLAGKKFFNSAVGLFSALVITFSIWEIEFSRQARYYSLFQLLYLLSLYFFYRGFIEDRKKDKILTVLCFTLTVFTQQLGLTLIFAFVFLLLIKVLRRRWVGASPTPTRRGDPCGCPFSRGVLSCFLIILVIFGSCFVIDNFFGKVGKLSPYEPGVKGILGNLFQKFSFHFFKEFQWLYPRMYYLIWLGLLFLVVEFVLVLRRRALEKSFAGWAFCYFLFISSLLMMGFGQAHFQPRYVFYLHPVFLFLYSYTLFKIGFYVYLLTSKKLFSNRASAVYPAILCAIVAAGFTINGGSPLTAYRIADRNYGDCMNVKFMPSTSRPFHYDHQSVGNFVRKNLKSEDIVIAMHPIFQYIYVGRYDYWLWSTRWWPAFFRKDGKLHENYTGAKVIRTLSELKQVLKVSGDRRIWIIASPSINDRAHINRSIARFLESSRERVLFRGRDRISRVFLWSPEMDGKFVYEGEGSLCRIGLNEFDETASWKCARIATVSDGAGHIVFGPYQKFPAGKYRVVFRMKVQCESIKFPVCDIDVAANSGKTLFAERTLYSDDFEGNSYQDFEFHFSIPEEKELEFRVYSHGNSDISVDCVTMMLCPGW